jgi:hypothetical protein
LYPPTAAHPPSPPCSRHRCTTRCPQLEILLNPGRILSTHAHIHTFFSSAGLSFAFAFWCIATLQIVASKHPINVSSNRPPIRPHHARCHRASSAQILTSLLPHSSGETNVRRRMQYEARKAGETTHHPGILKKQVANCRVFALRTPM